LALMLFGALAATFFFVAYWSLGIGILAFFAGMAYTFAGLVDRPPEASEKAAPARPAQAEEELSAKTGPGWHCTWCWAPLEKGSRYCNACGHRIE